MLDATPLLRLYARRRLRQLAALRPVEAQERQFADLITRAPETRFGRAHGFSRIRNVEDFQRRVPLRRYEQFWDEYWKSAFPTLTNVTWPGTIPYFAVTSGTTTGVTKYIPCSDEMNASNNKATADLLAHHLANFPRSKLLAGRNFMLGGSTALTELAPGIHSGDLSGIAAQVMPWWARLRSFPPPDLALMSDWAEKIARLAPLSLKADIRSISGTPSWLLIFFDKLAELRPEAGRRLCNLYPNLELLVHGGVNFAPYRSAFRDWLEGSRTETREVYAASEGFIAVADRGDGEGMRLLLDTGLFYEFVPVDELDTPNPTRHWLDTVVPDVNYAIVVSTCAGLWAYIVGDTVRFVGMTPPRILVTGRTSYTLSAFGEHLIGEEIEEAVSAAADAIGAAVTDYAVGALFPTAPGEVGGHLFIAEFAHGLSGADQVATFARALDDHLTATNEDYAAHRAGGTGMAAPRVHAVTPGRFAAWMASRGQLGGQHKVPRVITDEALFANLRAFMEW